MRRQSDTNPDGSRLITIGGLYEVELAAATPTPTRTPTGTPTKIPSPTPCGCSGPNCPTDLCTPVASSSIELEPQATPEPLDGAAASVASLPTGATRVRKYYRFGSQPIAMREVASGGASTVYYLVGDHLGSTTVILDQSGALTGEMRYTPYGKLRYTRGSLPTDRRFTGQRWEGDALAGLYDYNARFYDPGLGLFIQADTIVPEPGRPVALNRFAYGYNNPIKYNDPTGHCPEGDTACWEEEWYWKNRWYNAHGFFVPPSGGHWTQQGTPVFADETILYEVLSEAGIEPVGIWSFDQLRPVGEGAVDLANAIGKGLSWLKTLLGGGARVLHGDRTPRICFGNPACAPPPIPGIGENGHNIYFTDGLLAGDPDWARATVVHELAHVIDWNSAFAYRQRNSALRYMPFSDALPAGRLITDYADDGLARWEYWAEAVKVWVYPSYAVNPLTTEQSDFISRVLSVVCYLDGGGNAKRRFETYHPQSHRLGGRLYCSTTWHRDDL